MKRIDSDWEMAKLHILGQTKSKKMKLTDLQEQALSDESKYQLKKAYTKVLSSVSLEYDYDQDELGELNVSFNMSALDTLCTVYLQCKEQEKAHLNLLQLQKEWRIFDLATQQAALWNQLTKLAGNPLFDLHSREYHDLLCQLNELDPNWREIATRMGQDQRALLNTTTEPENSACDDDATASKSIDT